MASVNCTKTECLNFEGYRFILASSNSYVCGVCGTQYDGQAPNDDDEAPSSNSPA